MSGGGGGGSTAAITEQLNNADNDLYCFYKSADAINKLPVGAPNGLILKINGEDVNTADDYYVKSHS